MTKILLCLHMQGAFIALVVCGGIVGLLCLGSCVLWHLRLVADRDSLRDWVLDPKDLNVTDPSVLLGQLVCSTTKFTGKKKVSSTVVLQSIFRIEWSFENFYPRVLLGTVVGCRFCSTS